MSPLRLFDRVVRGIGPSHPHKVLVSKTNVKFTRRFESCSSRRFDFFEIPHVLPSCDVRNSVRTANRLTANCCMNDYVDSLFIDWRRKWAVNCVVRDMVHAVGRSVVIDD